MPYEFSTSKQLYDRATHVIAGGVNSGIRKLEQPVPLYFSHGRGSRVWDVDGNEYIDYQTGQGALLFGHAPEGLARELCSQARKGTHFAAQTALEIDVAERICAMIPSAELVRFNNSATEVVNSAFRLVRAHTGKPLIIKFEGHYHGWGDEGLVGFGTAPDKWGSDDEPANLHPSQGVISEVLDRFVVARWNDPEHLRRRVKQYSGKIGAIVLEPILCNTGCIEPVEGLIDAIREVCAEEGMLLIADETITGFRFGRGGAQEFLGFSPDLTILGKAIGGGVPFAALAGKRTAFEKIISNQVVHAGTLNSNPLCLAASRWCLDEVSARGDKHPSDLIALGRTLMDGLRRLGEEFSVPLRPQGPGLVFHTVVLKEGASEGPVRDYRDLVARNDAPRWAHLRRCLLEEGVRAIERGLWFMSFAHSETDVAETLERSRRAFERHASTARATGQSAVDLPASPGARRITAKLVQEIDASS